MLKKVIPILLTTFLALNATQLFKTGQTTSYQDYDDGYYEVGTDKSYTRTKDIVTDNVTRLQWQDDTDANTTKRNWEEATEYCESLPLGGYNDWRLPSIKELLTLIDYSKNHPSVTDVVFQNTAPYYYASSTTNARDAQYAWVIPFNHGLSSSHYQKIHDSNVRCVRGEQLDDLNFSRDYATEIVTESVTNLQWQDNEDAKNILKTFSDAIDYCEDLTLANNDDWRLPNQNELLSILDYTTYDSAIESTFQNISSTRPYRSSTSYANASTTQAWSVYPFFGSSISADPKTDQYSVRCVRGGKLNDSQTIESNITAIIMYLLN